MKTIEINLTPKSYYILSLKHSPVGNSAMWWRPNTQGYTSSLAAAGMYSQAQIDANPEYYNNGADTKAIPFDEVQAVAVMTVDFSKAKQLAGILPKP